MSKTRDTGYLANVIQVHDTGVRIMSGSTMLMAVSSSGAVTITGEISGSDAANALLLSGTGSVGFTTTSSFLAISSSQQQISSSLLQVSASYISLSGSYTTFSGSASTRITANSSSIQQVSSSQQQISSSLLNVISVFATTGSNSFRANQSITGSLVVSSTITAQTLVVQTVTSSIVYSSGSNNFGNQLSNNQTFTGSVNITGSSHAIFGNVGIGISSPSEKIHVFGSSGATSPRILIQSHDTANATAGLTLYGRDVSNVNKVSEIVTSGADLTISVNSTERMRINSCGNLGIGTCAPTMPLTFADALGGKILLNANSNNYSIGLAAGVVSADASMKFTAGCNTPGDFTFYRGSTLSMIITCAGNVGIGTCTPFSKLSLPSGTGWNGGLAWDYTSANGGSKRWWINTDQIVYGDFRIATEITQGCGIISSAGTLCERFYINNSGSVGIGTTNPTAYGFLAAVGTVTVNTLTGVVAGFSDNTLGTTRLYIQSGVNGISVDQAFAISTGGGTPVERMRITSTGGVCIGSSAASGEILRVNGCSCLDNYISVYSGGIQMFLDADKTNNAGIVGTQSNHPLILRTNGSNKLSISTAGVLDFPGSNSTATSASDTISFGVSGASYAWIQSWGGRPLRINELGNNVNAYGTNGYGLVNTTASDVRIKKNIVSIENALDKVNCLRGVYYEFDENNSMCMKVPSGKRRIGLIAQEVGCVLPEALLDSQDDSTPISLDYSGMIGLLTKAIQEQQCTINTLKTCLGIA
jgi:hypothetical protein